MSKKMFWFDTSSMKPYQVEVLPETSHILSVQLVKVRDIDGGGNAYFIPRAFLYDELEDAVAARLPDLLEAKHAASQRVRLAKEEHREVHKWLGVIASRDKKDKRHGSRPVTGHKTGKSRPKAARRVDQARRRRA